MVRPTHAVVDLDGLIANYRAIRGLLAGGAGGPPPRIVAVIKANAYGHGAARVARALEGEARGRAVPPPMLACADIEEGVDLRAAGVRAPILVFGALSVSDLDGVFAHGLTPTVSSPSAARALEEAAAARGVRLGVHLKIDTGMNRFGFRHDNLPATLPAVLRARHLAVEAVYTHYATAEDREHPLFERQRYALRGGPRGGARTRPRRRLVARRQQRRAAAGPADLVRRGAARPAAVRHRAAAAGARPAPAAGDVAAEPRGGGQGHASG